MVGADNAMGSQLDRLKAGTQSIPGSACRWYDVGILYDYRPVEDLEDKSEEQAAADDELVYLRRRKYRTE